MEASEPDAFFVFLADLWLDDAKARIPPLPSLQTRSKTGPFR